MAAFGTTTISHDPTTTMRGNGGPFYIDTKDILEMAWSFDNGPKVAQREFMKGMRLAVSDTRENIRVIAPMGDSGRLKAGLETRILQTNALRRDINAVNAGPGITGEVFISDAKVPWAKWQNYGRGPVRPVNKKWLRFRWKKMGNQIVFAKYVRPMAGRFFMEQGLAASVGSIKNAMDSAAERVVRYLMTRGVPRS